MKKRVKGSSITSKEVAKTELIEDEFDDNEDEKDDGYDSKGVYIEEAPIVKKIEPVKKVMIRTIAALFMCCFYLLILKAGHFYCIALGVLTQFELYRELVNVRYVEAKLRTMPLFRTLQWSWFLVAMFAVYSETIHKFCLETQPFNHLTKITENFSKYVFPLYCSIFVASVLTLKPGKYTKHNLF
jgi:phosphatidate cytidylyltransferase